MSWEAIEDAADRGPLHFFFKTWLGLLLVIATISVSLGVLGYALDWFGEAGEVAQKEYGPKAALQKYEWFIDQKARIQKMDADVETFRRRRETLEREYAVYGEPAKRPPDVRVMYQQKVQQIDDDLAAVVSQRNNLVREYNAASAKFNWTPFKSHPDHPGERLTEYVQP